MKGNKTCDQETNKNITITKTKKTETKKNTNNPDIRKINPKRLVSDSYKSNIWKKKLTS